MPATTLIAIMRGVKREEFFVPIMICTIFYDLLFGCALVGGKLSVVWVFNSKS